ncbi:Protein SAD1/UNC-84 domain protein 1 [Rhynchospora pubera]|uniref:Protein SAD1/UNC-84 domain protein 1 n=1 Tax=Rhynchospora pubera TaxID=906938 RepID=A0AAV8BVZ3_9POAL|nr:Protein SAD1/UNC-84 domain protein 1 [Rhynchospora pubera]KAJ4801199.1 Protein SAD1/UNC-84 domain protein 1 [Rhynchospora pubera]
MMSASTAAIPISMPNNHQASLDSNTNVEARKRIIAITKKPETNGTPQSDKTRVVSGRDLSHTIRGESVLERPRGINSPELKKQDVLRRKKPSSRQVKSMWLIVGNLMFKVCVLIAVISWISNAAWKLKEGKPLFGGPATPEERISEVEASLKKTTKMLQVQVDLVNKKIGTEIEKAQKDLSTQVQETTTALQSEIRKLEGRTDRLDQFMNEFPDSDIVSRKEFEEFIQEYRNHIGMSDSTELSLNRVSLDEMRLFAKEMVEREIERHAADGLGIVDYALWSGGARVVKHSEPFTGGKTNWFAAKGRGSVHSNAQKVLEPSFGEPGQCFALEGSSGFVEIKLRSSIVVQAVTLEHVAKSVAYDRSSAPKDCQLTAWHEGPDDDASMRAQRVVHMAEFTYDLDKSNAQTFSVDTSHSDQPLVNMVRLSFSSNHGNSALTCLYRFRVHGFEPGTPSSLTLQT